jgi:mono/diheme cytochrome c family protein
MFINMHFGKSRALGFLLLAAVAFAASAPAQTPKPEQGLTATFTGLDQPATDTVGLPNVWLYVPQGQPPTPFLAPGKFKAVWQGSVMVELRGNYAFSAELNGAAKLEVNGTNVLEVTGTGGASAPSKPLRLNKGANTLRVEYTSPASGDARLRLLWTDKPDKPLPHEPIPLAALNHAPEIPELKAADKLHLGRELLVEHRCVKCHTVPNPEKGIPELSMDAPSLEGIGSRRGYLWMARWIFNPKIERPSAHMPRVFNGPDAKPNAEAVAAYLASLKGEKAEPVPPKGEMVEAGKKLAETLHCAGCHNLPEGEVDPKKISLRHVSIKFPPGQLAAFIQKPEAHYAWVRMPKFNVSAEEAQQLAAYLVTGGDLMAAVMPSQDAAVLEQGRSLVQTSGCLNCHSLKLENRFKAVALADLPPAKWQAGCLAAAPAPDGKAPQYGFAADQLAALQAFGATDRASLTRHVPAEFAERQARNLNCTACHGQIDGFPLLPLIGGKLKPEWMKEFISGKFTEKPRPWLEARMPAFVQRADALAEGLAMSHGYPPVTPPEPPINMEATKLGQKLVSADGGFSCISCHGVASLQATQVFESAGINLSMSGARLQHDYYMRWVRNPIKVDPQTKMPVYFDEDGKSPLADYLDGDAGKQIETMWQYIRQGNKMIPPPPPQ